MDELQVENGNFTRIINKAIDELVKAGLLGAEFAIVFFVIRKTWGFNKGEDKISFTQFEQATQLTRPTVSKSLKNLIFNKILVKRALPNKEIVYKFNKYYTQWGSKAGLTSKAVLTRPSKHRLTRTSKAGLTHKRQVKDSIKDSIAAEPPEVNILLQFFKETVNDHLNFGNKTERKACINLLNTYGLEKTKQALLFLEEKRKTDKYLPSITTPYELWTKWAKIKQHLTVKKPKIWKPTSSVSRPFQQEANTNLLNNNTTKS